MRGFTLIELMIMIAIIGILAAIIIPAVSDEPKQVKQSDTRRSSQRDAEEFSLRDGTRCVVIKQVIHCDWRK